MNDSAAKVGTSLPVAQAWWRTDRANIDPAAPQFGTPIFAQFAAVARLDAAVPPGAAIATLLADPAEAVCALLACLASGHPCIPLNPHHPAARLADILADAAAAAVARLIAMTRPPRRRNRAAAARRETS